MKIKTIFGPINSRRFGKSLGIDLSPSKKQCNFDCLYCELAPAITMNSYDEVVSVNYIIEELKESLSKHKNLDVITITANGEPTLYPYLDELIDKINLIENRPKTLILSNGSTINNISVQNALLKLDSVKLSLDCASNQCLKKLDRSHKDISIEDIKDGMMSFRKKYEKPLIIEILFVKTINDKNIEIEEIDKFLLELKPDRVDIGTIDRPPAYNVGSLNFDELSNISKKFSANIPIYITSRKEININPEEYSEEEIIQTLSKRPLTDEDINVLFNENSQKRVMELIKKGKIVKKKINLIIFYILC
ncbi:Putative Fe-S oxidoreductase [hydrothermal vent metagenome]|uniref:Putative Fe-S oxidoreductase n=1 Tax=hydrothermal vent metagenome TaxID=652676 RepID=A0A1W1BYH5_9ZZZZ